MGPAGIVIDSNRSEGLYNPNVNGPDIGIGPFEASDPVTNFYDETFPTSLLSIRIRSSSFCLAKRTTRNYLLMKSVAD